MRSHLLIALRERNESGMAMIMTIAVIMLTAIISTTLLATTLFTTSNTTATRASVQAVAAAEAGVESVAQSLISGATCAGSYTSPVSGPVAYAVQVEYVPSGGSTWSTGCPPATADKVRITSTGSAASRGTGGNDRGDEATVEMLLERPVPVPSFNKAIFGDLNMTFNTNLEITSASGGDTADLYTNGTFTCATAMKVNGSVFVQGNALLSSSPCTIDGDMYVTGNMQCPSGTTIGGNLYVQGTLTMTGNASTPCKINGNVWSGSNASNSTGGGADIGGFFYVRGNLTFTGLPVVDGQTKVRGTLAGNTGYWYTQYMTTYPSTTRGDTSVGFPPSIPASPDNVFPKITPTDSRWSTFTPASWITRMNAIKPAAWINPCSTAGSPAWTTPLTITNDTVFNTMGASECPSGLTLGGSPMKIVLNADAVIFVKKFTQNGAIEVRSGDGQEHDLYIIHPWPATQTVCPSSPSGDNITLSSGAWTQPDNKTRVMLYSSQGVNVTTNPTIRGQLYGCNVQAATGTKLIFAAVGAASAPPDLSGLELTHIRDVTD